MIVYPIAWVAVMVTDGQQATAIATVLAAAIASGAAWVTQNSAAKRAAETTHLTNRTDIEKEAFSRASGYYKDAMDRQHAEIDEQRAEIDEQRGELRELQGKVTLLNARVRQLEHEAEVQQANHRKEVDRLKADLEAAKKALALKYPDE